MTTNKKIIWIILFVAAIFIYFFGLNIPLLGPDEPRYAQVAREMFERGDWISPTLGGANWFEKPALLYWLQIINYKIFGVSEFAARFGSAIFGLLTVFSLWVLGKNLTQRQTVAEAQKNPESTKDEGQRTKDNFANWLALISASSIGLITFSHGASFDIIITFPITASLVAFFLFDQHKQKSGFTFYFLLFTFYFFIGVALIAKGLIGIIFPFAIVAFYYILSWKFPSKAFIISFFWGTSLSLAVALIWYLPMYQIHGWTFIDEFIIQHHFQRFASNKYQHPQPFWFFWVILPILTLPWLPFFFASIWNFFKNLFQRKDKLLRVDGLPTPDSRLLTFAFAWMLVPLVFFSISGSKLPGYILPALPAALILTADYVWQFVQKSQKRELGLQILALVMFVVITIIMQFFVMNYAPHETVKSLIEKANSEGYSNAKVFNLHTVSHNAEFYAPNRLVRSDDGKLQKFYGVFEVVTEMKRENITDALVLVPLEYVKDVASSNLLTAKVLNDNGELAIVGVNLK